MARGVEGFDGAALRAARRAAPCLDHDHAHLLTVACLARRVGTSKSLILSYEHGRSSPSPQRLAQLARAVGVSASDLQRRAQLSDLRAARGLTLADVAAALGLAVNTYRQIESRGVLPRRRPGVFWDLAAVLTAEHMQLHEAIRQIPGVRERREAAADILQEVLGHALAPGPYRPLQDTSLPAQALAATYDVAPSAASKVVNLLLADLRQLAQQQAQLEARRDYTAHSRPSDLYERELEMIANRIAEDIARVPEILERYLVNPMSQSCWHSLARLYLAGPSGSALRATSIDVLTALEKAFGGYLIEAGPAGFRLAPPGVLFFLDTLAYYRVLYTPPDRAIRADPQHYGWPSFRSRAQYRRHRLRVAHVLGHDPHPSWDGGSWMTIQSSARTGDTWWSGSPWDDPPF